MFDKLPGKSMNLKAIATLSLAALASVFAISESANAAALSFADSIELQKTNFTDEVLSVSQFDASLGTLTGVELAFSGLVQGSAKYESLDAVASTVTADVAALLEVSGGPGNEVLFQAQPTVVANETATAFDGAIDFGGLSGGSFTTDAGSEAGSISFTDAASLSFFTGTDRVELLVSAIANSVVTGPGNLFANIRTEAGAEVVVTYQYDGITTTPPTASTPEPSTLISLIALSGLGFLARKRQVQA